MVCEKSTSASCMAVERKEGAIYGTSYVSTVLGLGPQCPAVCSGDRRDSRGRAWRQQLARQRPAAQI